MNCREFQKVMKLSVDGGLDSKVRQEVALHLAECEQCLQLINDDKFWDDAVLGLLDREAPADLRAEILGDLDGQPGLSGLGWKRKLKIMGWAGTRGKLGVWFWVETIALVVFVIWVLPRFLNK